MHAASTAANPIKRFYCACNAFAVGCGAATVPTPAIALKFASDVEELTTLRAVPRIVIKPYVQIANDLTPPRMEDVRLSKKLVSNFARQNPNVQLFPRITS